MRTDDEYNPSFIGANFLLTANEEIQQVLSDFFISPPLNIRANFV